MSLGNLELEVKTSLEAGKYEFYIEDINLHETSFGDENEKITYLKFSLIDNVTQSNNENLLSVPFNLKNGSINTKSSLAKILSKFNIDVTSKQKITNNEINKLIGRSFTGLVLEENGFSKVKIGSIEAISN